MSLAKLPYEDWIHSVPDTVGEQVHIHHCKTGRGNDKLYIKRVENGSVAYCHHCGQRGYASNSTLGVSPSAKIRAYKSSQAEYLDGSTRYSDDVHGDTEEYSGKCVVKSLTQYPIDAVNQVKRWSNNDAKIWILSYGLSMDTINESGICWSDKFSSILFPRYHNGTMVAYQTRKFPASKPKYLTYGDSTSLYDPIRGSTRGSTLVLVEDYLSCLKVSQITPAFALNGTGLKDTQLSYLLKDWKRFVIMLDNDNWQVKQHQLSLHKRIATFAYSDIVEVHKDPKEYELEDLKTLLRGYIT